MKSNISPCFPSVIRKENKRHQGLSNEIKPFWITRTLKSSNWDRSDHDQNSHMRLKWVR